MSEIELPHTQEGETYEIAYKRMLKALDRDPNEELSTSLDAFREVAHGKVALREIFKLRVRFGAREMEGLEMAIDRQLRVLTRALDDHQNAVRVARHATEPHDG